MTLFAGQTRIVCNLDQLYINVVPTWSLFWAVKPYLYVAGAWVCITMHVAYVAQDIPCLVGTEPLSV